MSFDRDAQPDWKTLYESDDIDRDIISLFGDQRFAELVNLMGDQARPWAARRGLQITVRHYLIAQLLASRKAAGKGEWKRIVRFNKTAKAFLRALDGIHEVGNAEQRLLLDLATLPRNLTGPSEQHFKKLLRTHGPGGPLRNLRLTVDALATTAERMTALTRDPSEVDPSKHYLTQISWLSTPGDQRNADSFCLQEALLVFRRVWKMNSRKPFDGGTYYSDLGAFVGDAIQAATLVMRTLEPKLTQRRIATAIREINARKFEYGK